MTLPLDSFVAEKSLAVVVTVRSDGTAWEVGRRRCLSCWANSAARFVNAGDTGCAGGGEGIAGATVAGVECRWDSVTPDKIRVADEGSESCGDEAGDSELADEARSPIEAAIRGRVADEGDTTGAPFVATAEACGAESTGDVWESRSARGGDATVAPPRRNG